ncbi:MAG: FAD-dependent oxidoreductase [Chloroflexota bacterium]
MSEMTKTADVVIIGGGVIGTATAYYLSKTGVDVCLVERNDIAMGTSSASATGVALQTKPPGPKQNLARDSINLFCQLVDELDDEIEFIQDGGMLAAESEEEFDLIKEKATKTAKSGIPVDVLTGDEVHELQPCLAPHVVGATYCPDGATVNPYLLSFAYVKAAKQQGARIHTYTSVEGIERDGDTIQTVLTNRGRIATNTVINAAGPWSPQLAQLAGVAIPVEPRKGELFVTAPVPPFVRGSIISASYLLSKALPQDDDEAGKQKMSVGLWAGQTKRGNLLIGSTREFSGYQRHSTSPGIHALVEQTTRLIPQAAKLHILRFYAGLRPSTPDSLPILGRHPLLPGLVLANGHEGDGIALSPATGKRIADLVMGEIDEESEMLAAFSPRRFEHKLMEL